MPKQQDITTKISQDYNVSREVVKAVLFPFRYGARDHVFSVEFESAIFEQVTGLKPVDPKKL